MRRRPPGYVGGMVALGRRGRRTTPAVIATLAALLVALAVPPGAAADRAYNILTPGQAGGVPFTQNSRDQMALYDALTPKLGDVTAADLSRLFKPERLGPVGATTVERTPRSGLTIRRDRFGVPHITGRSQADVWYGVGWVSALDRQLLLLRAREPARAAVADVPALNAFGLATAGLTYNPSPQAEALVHRQQALFRRVHGAKGRQILHDLAAYTAGVNAAWATLPATPTRTLDDRRLDRLHFIGSIFGNGGGAEAQNSDFLAALRQRLGRTRGDRALWTSMEADDPEAPTTIRRRFPFGRAVGAAARRAHAWSTPGRSSSAPTRRPDRGVQLPGRRQRAQPPRSASLAVMGPQLGYFYPEIVLEADLRGPGIRAQRRPGAGDRPLHPHRPDERLRLEPDHCAERQPRRRSSSSCASPTAGRYPLHRVRCRPDARLRRRPAGPRRRPADPPDLRPRPCTGRSSARRE